MAMQIACACSALVALAAGGVIWVFVYPILSGERKAEKRQESVARAEPAAARVAASARSAEGAPRAGRGDAEGARSPAEEAEEPAACRCASRRPA